MILLCKSTITILDKVNNIKLNFYENIVRDINEVQFNSNDSISVYKGNIFELFNNKLNEYIINNSISRNSIEILSIDITCDNEGIDLIINKDEVNYINFVIEIYAYNKNYNIPTPVLHGEAIDDNSIKLIVEDSTYAHKIYDSNNIFIGIIPSFQNEYIEKGLKPNTTYERKVFSYNQTNQSQYSNIISIKTKTSIESVDEKIFNNKYERKNNIKEIETLDYNLIAFKSGVGYDDDLKIYKSNETDYINNFKIFANIYGHYTDLINTFQKASFDYRIACVGKYEKQVTEGFVKFKIKSASSSSVKLRVYRYSYRNISVSWSVSATVTYKEISNLGEVNHTKNIRLPGMRFNFSPVVKLKDKIAYLEPRNNILINSTPLKKIVTDYVVSSLKINAENIISIVDYKLYDNYSFDKYLGTSTWSFIDANRGTLVVHTSNKNVVDENSAIYCSGYANAQLYDVEEYVTKTFYNTTGNIDILTMSDVNNIIPKNIDDRNSTLSTSDAINTITKVEIISVGEGIKTNDINLNNNVILSGVANLSQESPELQYKFSNQTPNIILNTRDLLSNNTSNTTYDYTLNILGCTDNISCTCGEGNVYSGKINIGQILKWKDNSYSNIFFEASSYTKIETYEDVIPNYNFQPYHGVINGDIDLSGECQKKDMMIQVPKFLYPLDLKDVKFRIILEKTSPSDAHVNYRFLNEIEPGYTNINGDYVLFNSEANKKIEKEVKDILSVQFIKDVAISNDSFSTMNLIAHIEKPSISNEINNNYSKYSVELITSTSDVVIDEYEDYINFDYSNTCTVPYKVKFIKDATAKWCPLIKNGYYYLNQNEYYLYSQTDINTTYEDVLKYYSKNSNYKIKVNLNKMNSDNDIKIYSLRNAVDFIANDKYHIKDFLYPKPIIKGIYYEEYNSFTALLKEINFNKTISKYNYIKWETSKISDEIKLYIRSYNIDNNSWSDWVLLKNNSVPEIPLSYKIQLQAEFSPIVEYQTGDSIETLSSYNEFYSEYDKDISTNIYLMNGGIQAFGGTTGTYYSKILKYETKTKMKLESYYTVNKGGPPIKLAIYIAGSDSYDDLSKNPNWKLMDGITYVSGKYLRYRIDIQGIVNIVTLYKTLSTTKTIGKPQGIKNIQISVQNYTTEEASKSIYVDKSYSIDFDCNEYVISNDLQNEIEYPIINSGYTINDISDIEIINNDSDVLINMNPLTYNINDSDINEIFKTWFVSGSHINYWEFNDISKTIKHASSSNTLNCFISSKKYIDWNLSCKITSKENGRNPIGIVLGYEKDSNGEEHILTLLVGPNKKVNGQKKVVCYSVYYNYSKHNEELIYSGTQLIINNSSDFWSDYNYDIAVEVRKTNNIIDIYRSQYSKEIVDLDTKISIDLDTIPQLIIFNKRTNFGFCTCGQLNSTFSNISIHVDDKINSNITAKSKFTKTISGTNDLVEFIENKAILSPLPQQFSPITVETINGVPLQRVHFKKDNQYILTNTERFIDAVDSVKLSYSNVHKESIKVNVNGVNIDENDFSIINNYIVFNVDINLKNNITVEYKINNSFVVNYAIEQNEIEVEIFTSEYNNKAFVKYETNKLDNRKKIEHLSLNPVHNTYNEGFIYLSNEDQKPSKIEIYCNPKYVYANGYDNISFCVRLLDEYNNPVPGQKINVTSSFGRISLSDNITDINGIVSAKYFSSIYKCSDYIYARLPNTNIYENIIIENLEE